MHKSCIFRLSIIILLFTFYPKEGISVDIKKDTVAEKLLNEIQDLYLTQQYEEMRLSIEELSEMIAGKNIPYYSAKVNKYRASYYASKQEIDSANYYYEESATDFLKVNDSVSAGKAMIRIGFNLKVSGDDKLAIEHYTQGIDLLKSSDEAFWIGLANDHIGFILFKQGDYFNALQHYQLAINKFININDELSTGTLYNKIGITYRKTMDKDKEEEAYLLGIYHFLKIDTTLQLGQSYNNLAELYIDKGAIEEGLQMLEKARLIYEKVDYPLGLCSYYSVLGYYYMKKNPPEYTKVIDYMTKSMPIAEEHGDLRQLADGSHFLGEAYLHIHKPNEALKVLLKGYIIAEDNQFEYERLQISNTLYKTYKYLNNNEKALKYLEIYSALNDTILNENKIKEFTQLDMSFKFKQEQITDSIEQQRKERELIFDHHQELQQQKQIKIILYFATGIFLLIAAFIFIYARRNRRQAIILNEKNETINATLDEKVLLLEEVHHRVKNNFQLVSSLLELQSKEIVDKKALMTISEGQNRVRAMALIHQKLYENEDIKNINFGEYCAQLVNELQNISPNGKNVVVKMNIGKVFFDIDTAIPIGLILNELVTNCFKYAFNSQKEGVLIIEIIKESDKAYKLLVADNGPGLPTNLDMVKTKSLGLKLVRRLSKQLQGSCKYTNENGSVFQVTFKNTLQRRASE